MIQVFECTWSRPWGAQSRECLPSSPVCHAWQTLTARLIQEYSRMSIEEVVSCRQCEVTFCPWGTKQTGLGKDSHRSLPVVKQQKGVALTLEGV